ncbi:MAG: hypothetical protein ACOCTG_03940 [Bacteroidota bacterium]
MLLAVMLLTAGCEPDADRVPDREADTQRMADQESTDAGVSVETMVEQTLSPAPDRPYPPFLDRLNEPERVETEVVENRHVPGQMDTVRTYIYDGLEIEVYDRSQDERKLVRRIELLEPGFDHGLEFDVGDQEMDVRQAMGEPEEAENGELRFRLTQNADDPVSAPNHLHVRLRNDRVDALRWSFYVD